MANNYVITIARQFCSGGNAVGELLAKKLDIKMYDKQLITMAAKKSGY
ncbi:MAG: cytidylate kinase family protein, partial [Firmicutes bacterium]|nr:cytidylate kinase family protein [Bacillota bacterium]